MSTQTNVLYGNRLYGRVTYSVNQDPQTLTATLTDTQASSEADIFNTQKPLSDTQASSETFIKSVQKILADTQGSSESRVASLLKALTEMQGSSDSAILASAKAFSDLLTLTEALTNTVEKVLSDTQSTSDAKTAVLMRIFSESQASSDAMLLSGGKALSDLLALVESPAKTVQKSFSEIATSAPFLYSRGLFGAHTYSGDFTDTAMLLKDQIVIHVSRILAESISVADSTVMIHQTKGFLDFMVLQEWVNIKLKKADIWSSTSASTVLPSTFTLFGRPLYAQKDFSANPVVSWGVHELDSVAWNSRTSQVSQQTLYGKTLFGQSLYSDIPIVFWFKMQPRQEAWTNQDGQNNQEA